MNGNTTQSGTSRPSTSQPQGWRDFCELHAAAVARELAKHYRLFARERPLQDVLPPDSFSKQFSDLFQRHFSREVSRNAPPPPPPPPAPIGCERPTVDHLAGLPGGRPAGPPLWPPRRGHWPPGRPRLRSGNWSFRYGRLPPLTLPAPPPLPAAAARRRCRRAPVTPQRYSPPPLVPATPDADITHLSVSQIQQSVFASMFRGRRRAEPRGSFKEGQLRYMVVDDTISDVPPRWQRCRLLVRRGSNGFWLELFDPPKSSSSKLMAKCSDVSEVRRCNRLEMPDNVNTFVLKVKHYPGSFIFEADNDQQVSSWTTEIKECINNGSGSADVALPTMPLGDTVASTRRGSSESAGRGSPPFARSEQMCRKGDHFLWAYPWFHGPISRVKAAHLVQTSGADGHGVFLVRQSETRRGDYVLTFNFQGKAKHLRLSLTEWGQCRVQHLSFASVSEMLSRFCLSPIPLECGAACDVRLSSFVVAGPAPSGQCVTGSAVLVPFSLHRWSSEPSLTHFSSSSCPRLGSPESLTPRTLPTPGQLFQRSSPPTPERPHLDTLRRSESDRRPLQRHAQPHPSPLPQRDSDYELEPPNRGRKRAIDNQYTFL
ncbi:hypothetical protein ANANG_G00186970 [Anguilla anguilla]|uniref:SH2 domain-containing protein n=1 Tax=Anguilla anguilla TaxID=7936 RepID=A0A9D3M280_ANGAN|nr:hypothetical protein ANANG_G00186970 [Anguilla anguilla]